MTSTQIYSATYSNVPVFEYVTSEAVSYTHLDVYKRQDLSYAEWSKI